MYHNCAVDIVTLSPRRREYQYGRCHICLYETIPMSLQFNFKGFQIRTPYSTSDDYRLSYHQSNSIAYSITSQLIGQRHQ